MKSSGIPRAKGLLHIPSISYSGSLSGILTPAHVSVEYPWPAQEQQSTKEQQRTLDNVKQKLEQNQQDPKRSLSKPSPDGKGGEPDEEIEDPEALASEASSILLGLKSRSGEAQSAISLLRTKSRSKGLASAILERNGLEDILQLCESSDTEVARHALTCLYNFSLEEAVKPKLAKAVAPLASTLATQSAETSSLACATLYSLSICEGLWRTFLTSGAIPALVCTLKAGKGTTKADACKALFNLSRYWSKPPAHEEVVSHMVKAGAISALTGAASHTEKASQSLPEKACLVLRNVVKAQAGITSLATDGNAISSLVEVLDSDSPLVQESAVVLLLAVAEHSPESCRLVWEEAPMMYLDMLQRRGTAKARQKATTLLEMLNFS